MAAPDLTSTRRRTDAGRNHALLTAARTVSAELGTDAPFDEVARVSGPASAR